MLSLSLIRLPEWSLLLVLALLLLNTTGRASEQPLFDPKGLSLIIGGNGNITTKGPAVSVFGANIGLVQTGTLGLPFQLGIRQTFEHQRLEETGESVDTFTTRVFYDVIFLRLSRRIDAAVGANIGILYGNTSLQWQAAPEVGFRWWIKPNVAVVGRVDYPFNLTRGRAVNVLNYFIGVQVNLEK